MVQRADAWFRSLSPEDQRKFSDRLWAAVNEERDGGGTEEAGEPEGRSGCDGPGSDSED